MVTYVDYVEYDGPAFKAGMREGDVILSINGHEMDRADHKTLVNFIKNCDSRMRMVVSFEDCVRKVELHMRYIELQRALQSRLAELDRLCERERSILMGRWKTHSLPARKKAPNCDEIDDSTSVTLNTSTVQCCRPAASIEHLLLYSVYADGRPCLIPRSTACLVTIGPPRSRSDHHYFLSKNSIDSISLARHSYHQANGLLSTPAKTKSSPKPPPSPQPLNTDLENTHNTSHNNLCVACISSANSQRQRDPVDSGNLDVYDLASPCCDPNCVPSRRRREKQRRMRNEQQQQQQQQEKQQAEKQQRQQQQQQQQQQQKQQHQSHNCSRASGHSLHSITSSDMSTTIDSVASCSTSLSTDTLYWDPNIQHRPPTCIQYSKPKSWDNLTTKAFGGYGFGYGYLDTSTKTHSAERPNKGSHRSKTSSGLNQRKSVSRSHSNSSTSTQKHFQPTKSTESLLVQSPYQSEIESNHSCECLDKSETRSVHDKPKRHEESGYSGHHHHHHHHHDQNHHHHHHHHHQGRHRKNSHSDSKIRTNKTTEVTRL
ncbi:myb-like protein P isoform X2 [Chelonus insularis]|nr:myb-like protein P isoform X2 [Chelonus insularis]XP_034947225.1 myb-like protein P isoform X2 [Chelonus insularis]